MNPALNQLITAMHDEGVAPSIIHEVDDNTMYVGYCLPDTQSFDDKKCLVTPMAGQKPNPKRAFIMFFFFNTNRFNNESSKYN